MHRGRTVRAMDCVRAGAEWQRGRPLNWIVRHRRIEMRFPRAQIAWAWFGLPIVAATVMLVAQRGGLNRPPFWEIAFPVFAVLILHGASINWRWAKTAIRWRVLLVSVYMPIVTAAMLFVMVIVACVHGDCL